MTAEAGWAPPILMIDDNATKRFALRAILEPLGLPIVEAGSGLDGLRCLVAQDFAVILLDVRMPVMDGFETAALIRKRKQSELTPIIFITAHNKDEFDHADHYAEGAVDFMMAPVAPEELRAKVKVFAQLFAQAADLAAKTRALQVASDEMGALNRELTAIARRDALTGLRNRRALAEDLALYESHAARYGHSYCMAMLDIDLFKGYNDTFGHQTGDEILQLVAGQLTALLRDGDTLYRYGGEEFLVIFPEQSLESGGLAVERMRAGIEALRLAHPTAERGILTFSAGLGILEGGSKRRGGDVLLEADQALYRAKALGRNRIVCFDPAQTTANPTTTNTTADELSTDELSTDVSMRTDLETEVVTELVAGVTELVTGVTELVTEVNELVTNQLETSMAGTDPPAERI